MKLNNHNDIKMLVLAKQIPAGIEFEYRFDKVRRWRFDMAYVEYKLSVEIEGGIFSHGRHTRGSGFIKDMEKYNAAVLQGWSILRYAPNQITEFIDDVNKFISEVK